MTAAQFAEMAALSEAEIVALAYEEAAHGDLHEALRCAVEDCLALEARLATTAALISRGFVRDAVPAGRT